MITRTTTARATAAVTALATVATGLGWAALPARPAAAQAPAPGGWDTPMTIAGDFLGDGADELFVYWPGRAGPDQVVTFGRDASGAVVTRRYPFPVNGTYQPAAGDVDGDGKDELLWHGVGGVPDSLWDFTGPASVSTRPLTVNGGYLPLMGDFTQDGADDILWYAAGATPDHMWEFDPGGAVHDSRTTVNGYYQPVVGSFGGDGTDDIYWYAYVPAEPDTLWDFRPGGAPSPVSRPLPVSGAYDPVALDMWGQGEGSTDIVWYGFGADADHRWDFVRGALQRGSESVNGYYHPVVGGDFFGDGAEDLLWFVERYPNEDRVVNVWEHTVDGAGDLVRRRYQLGPEAWFTGP